MLKPNGAVGGKRSQSTRRDAPESAAARVSPVPGAGASGAKVFIFGFAASLARRASLAFAAADAKAVAGGAE